MTEWCSTLTRLLDAVWTEIDDSIQNRTGGRRPVIATLDHQGAPRVRISMLRYTNRDLGVVHLHTDATTPKVGELAKNPEMALHLWNDILALQIRLSGKARVLTGPALDQQWAELPDEARGNFGVTPTPGTPIGHSADYSRVVDRARFAVIEMTFTKMDIVVLSPDHHRRAMFERDDDWAGQWVAP